MKKVSLEFLINHKELSRKGFTFSKSFMIYRYKTQIEFIYEGEAIVICYLHQSDDSNSEFNNTILLGIVLTESDVDSLIKKFTREN